MTAVPALTCAALTDVGRVRARNEDNVFADPSRGLFAVADGMGGHHAGDVASRLAIDTLAECFTIARPEGTSESPHTDPVRRRSLALVAAVERANARIYRAACLERRHAGMGTTIVAASVAHSASVTHAASAPQTLVTVAHVGDSRLYRFSPSRAAGRAELTALTRDHSSVQQLVDRGNHSPEEARKLVRRNYLTRALGVEPEVAVDVATWSLVPTDILLLCSDGLTHMLDDATIRDILDEGTDLMDLEQRAQRLVDEANRNGGHDNIGIVLVSQNIRTARGA